MVYVTIHPLAANKTFVSGFNNAGLWAIEGVVRIRSNSTSITASSDDLSNAGKLVFSTTSAKIELNAVSGTHVATESTKPVITALFNSTGHKGANWNGVTSLNQELELIPQTLNGANAIIVSDGVPVDIPFRFEFSKPSAPTCEVDMKRHKAHSRYRLNVLVKGKHHGLKSLVESNEISLIYDVPVPFFDHTLVKELIDPQQRTWSGSTEQLDWSLTFGSMIVAPASFMDVVIKANLRNRTDAGRNETALEPSTLAAAARNKSGRPVNFICRARLSIIEEASIETYSAATTPLKKGFRVTTKPKASSLTDVFSCESATSKRQIMTVQIDGENLLHGHHLKVQLPQMTPVYPTHGSVGIGIANIDTRMSTGETIGSVSTEVQTNPSGTWGPFKISHKVIVHIDAADGHTVYWEHPIQVAACTFEEALELNASYPEFIRTDSTASLETTELEEAGRKILRDSAEWVADLANIHVATAHMNDMVIPPSVEQEPVGIKV